ncbi:MAG: xylulokinase [Planctomycetota bacterium]|jgi:xylulokinase
MDRLLLGIDVGTSGCKAVLVTPAGDVAARAGAEYPIHSPRPLWTEQDPEDWWRAAVASIAEALERAGATGGDVAAVGLTGQMHGMVLLDADGEVLRPCIMWNDQRTAEECAEITRRVGPERVIRLTGNPVLPGFTAPKLAWTRRNEPEVFSRAARVLLPKDYLRYRLTGEFISEPSDASGTAFFDISGLAWSQEMLEAAEIPADWLPRLEDSPAAGSSVSAGAAAACGLLQGTPVAGGGGDQAAQAVGMGIVDEGCVSVSMGTSAVLFAPSDTCRVEPGGRLHTFCHAVPGQWALLGVVLSAGGSLRWHRDVLCEPEKLRAAESGADAYDLMLAAAEGVPAGSEGLFFLPYLTGNRVPHHDPHARGAFVGLVLRHTRAHLTRALIEGVSFALNDSLENMRELGLRPAEIIASGGGARSELWRRVLADLFAARITAVTVDEGAAFGAALLAGVGAGVYPDVPAACRAVVRRGGSVDPGPGSEAYAGFYRRYRELYPALREQFAAISGSVPE